MPNVFTPNNDGINDFFTISSNQDVVYEIVILNRWGEVVFAENEKILAGVSKTVWDGGVSPDGVYFVKLKVTPMVGEDVIIEDFVTVVR